MSIVRFFLTVVGAALACGTVASAGPVAFDARWEKPDGSVVIVKVPEGSPARVGLRWVDPAGLLRAATDVDVPAGAERHVVRLPTDGRWAALAGGHVDVILHGADAEPARLPVARLAGANAAVALGKPMSHGTLRRAGLPPAHWHVTDDHTLVWDGRLWIPFGGMFCSPVLSFYDTATSPMAERWRAHADALDRIQAAGFDELYINLSHGPVNVRQQVVDDLNRREIKFGWQLNGGSVGPLQGYFVRRSTRQGLIVGRCNEPGKLVANLPRADIHGLLLVGVDDASVTSVRERVNLADPNAHPGFIQIDAGSVGDGKSVRTTLTIEDLPPGEYYVIPNAAVKSHASNVWGNVDAIVKRHAWVTQVRWGDGLRFLVDPIMNEEGVYNQAEPVRAWTEAFNADYAAWLARRYKTVDALVAAWRLPAGAVTDFATASRLVPLRDADAAWGRDAVRWIDPTMLSVTTTVGGVGQGWLDYVEGMRDTYADCRDAVTRGVKAMLDVPVVFKRVTPWVNREAINRSPGGMDGVGLELYPATGSMFSDGLVTGSTEAKLAAQTTWLMATEMGYSPATDNKGVTGFPSEKYVEDLVGTAATFGAKGFMFFGWRLEPYHTWTPMQLYTQPQQLTWIANVRARLLADWPEPWPVAQSFPEGQNWWWKSGGQSLTRYSAVLDDGPSVLRQSAMLRAAGGGDGGAPTTPPLWAVSSTPIIPHAAVRLVNLATRESADRYGPQIAEWIRAGERVVYVGPYPTGANVAGLEEHFTDDRIRIAGDDAQVLRVSDRDVVLARENGRPWAKRSGPLLIIARWSATTVDGGDRVPAILDPAWLNALLDATPTPAAHDR